MRTLYVRRSLANLGPQCRVLHVSPFLRELILQIVKLVHLRARNPLEHSLAKVLLWQLDIASPLPTGVAIPVDPRALAVAQATLLEPGSTAPLQECCRAVGVGVRTLQRIFRKELGQDFETWRRHVRLVKSVELLVNGRSVKEVAYLVGYREASTFIAVFRSAFGLTPKVWVRTFHYGD